MDLRRLLLFLFLIFVIIPIKAQTEKPISKKYFLVGGSLGFNMNNLSGTNKDGSTYQNKTNTFNSDIYFGYFFINQLAIGINPDFEFQWHWANNNVKKTMIFTLNSFLRYYFRFGLFGEGTIGIGFSKEEFNSDLSRKREVSSWGLGVGYSLFITNSIAIEPVLSYKSHKGTDLLSENKDVRDTMGLYFHIGFQIYLKTNNN